MLCGLAALKGDLDLCPACAKIERLPTQQGPAGAVPRTARRVGWQHGSGNTGKDGLRKQEAEDVVCRRTVGLPEQIGTWKIGGFGDRDGSLGRLLLSASRLDCRKPGVRGCYDLIER